MAELNVQKSSFFKEKKEEPNYRFLSCERCINGKYKSVRETDE